MDQAKKNYFNNLVFFVFSGLIPTYLLQLLLSNADLFTVEDDSELL